MKSLKDIALIMLNLTKLSRRQVSLAAGVSPPNATHWLNGRIDAFSLAKQVSFVEAFGLKVETTDGPVLDLSRGKLHEWVWSGNASDIVNIFSLCLIYKLEDIKIFRYEGTPSREAILMIPADKAENAIWIRLKSDSSADKVATIDSSVLGFGQTIKLTAQDWFEGINEGENDVTILYRHFSNGLSLNKQIHEHFLTDDDMTFSVDSSDFDYAQQNEWNDLLPRILERDIKFEDAMKRVRKLFGLNAT